MEFLTFYYDAVGPTLIVCLLSAGTLGLIGTSRNLCQLLRDRLASAASVLHISQASWLADYLLIIATRVYPAVTLAMALLHFWKVWRTYTILLAD